MGIKRSLIRNIDARIVKDWEELWRNSELANYFNSPSWFMAAVETFNYEDFVILTVYKNGKLSGVLPLVAQKRFGINFYTVPADYTCGSPFLVRKGDKKILAVLIRMVSVLGNVYLDEVPEDVVVEIRKLTKNSISWVCSANYRLDLDDNVVLGLKSNGLLYKARKERSDLFVKESSGYSKKNMDWVFGIDDDSPKRAGGYSTFANQNMRTFYSKLASMMEKHFLIHILTHSGRPIAYTLGFVVRGIYYGNQTAYVAGAAKIAPGKVLLADVAEMLHQEGVKSIDFGSGDSPYKRSVTSDYKDLYKVVISKKLVVRRYASVVSKLKLKLYVYLSSNKNLYVRYRKLMTWHI